MYADEGYYEDEYDAYQAEEQEYEGQESYEEYDYDEGQYDEYDEQYDAHMARSRQSPNPCPSMPNKRSKGPKQELMKHLQANQAYEYDDEQDYDAGC